MVFLTTNPMRDLTLDERTFVAKRDDNGYPLLEDGSIDWELTSHEKDKIRQKYKNEEAVFNKPKTRNTNRTPPKKKRK